MLNTKKTSLNKQKSYEAQPFAKQCKIKMAQDNLISHKGVLSYDKHNEKQIYYSLKN